MRVASALGQPFRVQIDLFGSDVSNAERSCFKAQLKAFDGAPLGTATVGFRENSHTLIVSTRTPVNEPAANLTVSYPCNPRMQRDYAILLDLPSDQSSVPLVQTPRSTARDVPGNVSSPSLGGSGAEVAAPPPQRTARSEPRRSTTSTTSSAAHKTDKAESKPRQVKESAAPKKQAAKDAGDQPRNVLKLGNNEEIDGSTTIFRQRLALSYSLAAPPAADAAAQNQPAADAGNATGEATPVADDALQQLIEKIRTLEARTAALQRQNAQQMTALDEARKAQESSSDSMHILYLVLLICALAIGWLVWRMRKAREEVEYSSWQQIVPDAEEPEPVVQQGSQASMADASPFSDMAAQPDVVEVAQVAVEPEKNDVVVPTPMVSMPFGRRKKKAAEALAARKSVTRSEDTSDQEDNVGRMTVTNAEEILDEIQEAEFWVHMNQPERAVAILESDDLRPTSPLKWLHLFDLYRMTGDQEKYELLSTRFKQVFNGRITPWGQPEELAGERHIEDFPFVMEQIIAAWPTPDLVPFMESLLIDDRDGNRQGFDLLAYRDLLFLTNIAYQVHAMREADPTSDVPAFLLPEGEDMFRPSQEEPPASKDIPPLEWPGKS